MAYGLWTMVILSPTIISLAGKHTLCQKFSIRVLIYHFHLAPNRGLIFETTWYLKQCEVSDDTQALQRTLAPSYLRADSTGETEILAKEHLRLCTLLDLWKLLQTTARTMHGMSPLSGAWAVLFMSACSVHVHKGHIQEAQCFWNTPASQFKCCVVCHVQWRFVCDFWKSGNSISIVSPSLCTARQKGKKLPFSW